MYRNGKLDSPWGLTLPKTCITWKKLQITVVRNWIWYKKLCPYPPWVELGGYKDQYVRNLIMYRNGKLDSPWASTLSKICSILKKNVKIFWNRISYKKVCESICLFPPRVELWGTKGLPFLNFWNVNQNIVTLMGEINMHSRAFLYKFNSEPLLFEAFFDKMCIFFQRWVPKWTYFPIIIHYNIENMNVLSTLWRHGQNSCWWAGLCIIVGLGLYGRRLHPIKRIGNIFYGSVTQCYHLQFPCFGILSTELCYQLLVSKRRYSILI